MRSFILLLSAWITRIRWLGPVGTTSASSSSPCESRCAGFHGVEGGKRGRAETKL